MSTVEQIARRFSQLLTAYIGDAKVRVAINRNKLESYEDCCASHDFCDANMVMLEAFNQLSVKPPTDSTAGPEQDEAVRLWGAAWDLARENKFYLGEKPDMSKIMKAVVDQLRAAGLKAAYEYPGYISIGPRSYGTTNGTWGWSDEDGNGGETDLGGDCAQPDLIVAEIKKVEQRFNVCESEKEYLDAITHELQTLNYMHPSSAIHTGGGIFCICVRPTPRVELWFGTSDAVWGCDVYIDDEYTDRSISSETSIDYLNPKHAAITIMQIVADFRRDTMEAMLKDVDTANDKKKAEREFQQAVENFRDAAGQLVEKWEHLPADSNFQDGDATKYPFDQSFDDLYHNILDWAFQITSVKV